MRQLLTVILIFSAIISFGQTKTYVEYSKLTDLEATEFMVASIENSSKVGVVNPFLLFINTRTGENKQIDFPKDSYIQTIEQIKIDNLGINKVIILGKTVNLDGNKSIDWSDPLQIFVSSPSGEDLKQVTAKEYFVRTWNVNKETGTLVVSGHYDTNKNGKKDKEDKNEIILIDLKSLEIKNRI